MDDISLLIKPSSARCNLQCTYCFYSRVKDLYPEPHTLMTLETAETLIRKTLELGLRENSFCWQGGEPTLMGIGFFQEVVRLQRRYATPGQIIANSLQTNGILLDDRWAEFLAGNSFLVGLSLDGPRECHDHYRTTPSGRGTFDRVMSAAKYLEERGAEFNILTLLSDRNVNRPDELYRFFRRHGFSHLQFVPCVETDHSTGRPFPYSVAVRDLGRFHCILFDLWMKSGFYDVSIRTFEEILIAFIDGVGTSCVMRPQCSSYLVVEHNGDVYPCDFFVYPEWKLGNINEDSYSRIFANPLRKKFAVIKSALPEQCRSCRWLDLCRGDCPRFRPPAENGEAHPSVLCEARKMLFQQMEPHLPRIREEALRIRRRREGAGVTGGVRRNDRCPCGSGMKYKSCCGR
ncbi:anaerobic sulfatase maturase [Syntrophobacter fumaroxidans]|uniref:Radical SAM domain protein n=1 Tax=Syntrophobacter fumaroxidans (strain DSM 10017 / MPOB) TaxID=335543 RepID=A0LK87_SYNFM|nr:anaerobic sulfatase maturase [Syntrophobacter fumaroxidans]ABK17839.1 Radical SAM domain protein [Syntrophobacter fumaroxidans MPOB]